MVNTAAARVGTELPHSFSQESDSTDQDEAGSSTVFTSVGSSRSRWSESTDQDDETDDSVGCGVVISNKTQSAKSKSISITLKSVDDVFIKNAKLVIYSIVTPAKCRELKWSSTMEKNNAENLLSFVKEMILSNQNNFVNMVKKIPLTPENACDTFRGIANEVLMKDDIGITWTRIIILYAFSTSIARHCLPQVGQGLQSEFIEEFSSAVGKTVEKLTSSWVVEQGGWSYMKIDKKDSAGKYLLSAVQVGAAVLGALFTVASLGSSTTIFSSMFKH